MFSATQVLLFKKSNHKRTEVETALLVFGHVNLNSLLEKVNSVPSNYVQIVCQKLGSAHVSVQLFV